MGFFYHGKLYEWGRPDKLMLFPHLNLLSKIRYALHVTYTKSIRDWTRLDQLEATQWIKKWIGKRAYQVLWEKLFELKFFEYSNQLSAAWIGARIQRVAKSRQNLFTEELGYLEGGSEVLLAAYRQRIEASGGEILLRAPVLQVLCNKGKVTGVRTPAGQYTCDTVISTVPLKYVFRFIPDLTEEERLRIAALENIGVVCVLLKLTQPLSPYFWININDPDIKIPGIIEYTNLNPLADSIIYVPYYMPKTNSKYNADDQFFIDEITGYCKRINPLFRVDWIKAAQVSRYEFAQPVCTPGFFAKLPKMKTSISGFFMADTAYYYPEDRSITESIAVGRKLAELAQQAL